MQGTQKVKSAQFNFILKQNWMTALLGESSTVITDLKAVSHAFLSEKTSSQWKVNQIY